MSGLTRRKALLGAAGVAIVSALGGALLWSERDLIRATLVRMIGPFNIADADMDAFVRDFMAIGPLPRGFAADAVGVVQAAGLLPAAGMASQAVGERLDAYQRGVLTAFVMGTDYFQSENPAVDDLHYLGPFAERACANPFARFD